MPDVTTTTAFATLAAAVHAKAPPAGQIGTIEFRSGEKAGTVRIWRKDDGSAAITVTFPGLSLSCDLPKDGKLPEGSKLPVPGKQAGQIASIVKRGEMVVDSPAQATPAKPLSPLAAIVDHKSAEEFLYAVIIPPAPAPGGQAPAIDACEEFWVAVGKAKSGFKVECCGGRSRPVTFFRLHRRDVDESGKVVLAQTLEFEATTLSKNDRGPFKNGVAKVYEGPANLPLERAAVEQTFIAWVRLMTKERVGAPLISEVPPPPPPPVEAPATVN